jgi:uncharacterized protein YqgV (UPF0045/DUF77 family)
MPGYHRAELSAELKIIPSPRAEKAPQAQIEAGRQAANASGLVAHEAGPDVTTALAGGRDEVLDAVRKVAKASLDAGAHVVQVKMEAQEEAGKFGGAGGRRA